MSRLATAALACSITILDAAQLPSPATTTSSTVGYWDVSAAVAEQKLSYEEQAVAYALQGEKNFVSC